MDDDLVVRQVLDSAICVHRHFGPGVLESVYAAALALELRNRGLKVEREVAVGVTYAGEPLGVGFRIDLLVEDRVIVEVKAIEKVPDVAYKIVINYLSLTGLRLGLLINFRSERLVDGFRRLVYDRDYKKP